MAQISFGGVVEEVVTSEEFSLEKARQVLNDEIIAVLGYGVQGPGQALNMRDNGINVIVGQRQGTNSWERAVADGFVPGKTLFSIEEAARARILSSSSTGTSITRASWSAATGRPEPSRKSSVACSSSRALRRTEREAQSRVRVESMMAPRTRVMA